MRSCRWGDDMSGLCNLAQMATRPMAHIRLGPILLARSKRVGASEAELFSGETVWGKERTCSAAPIRHDHMQCLCRVQLTADGETREYLMCDYASAANRDLEDVRYFSIFV